MARLIVAGEAGLDMPLRVLDLASRLGLAPDRVVIEAKNGECIVELALPEAPERAVSMLVERLRSAILVGRVDLDAAAEIQPRKLCILCR